jgi:hypothetical protein
MIRLLKPNQYLRQPTQTRDPTAYVCTYNYRLPPLHRIINLVNPLNPNAPYPVYAKYL